METLLWQLSLGGSQYDEGYGVQQTADGNYITAGFSASTDGNVTGNHGNTDFWVVKLKNTGVVRATNENVLVSTDILKVYPTLTSGTINIDLQNTDASSATIELMNLAGQMILSKRIAVGE